MRPYSLFILAAGAVASASLSGCDTSTTPTVAAVGGTTLVNSTDALIISPNRVAITAGTTVQMNTNAPANLRSQVQWGSSNTTVATISPSGLVSGVAAGSSIITARYAFDTTRVASATVDVNGTTGAARNP